MAEKLNPREARQGERGAPILKVLIAAIVLALVTWGAIEVFSEATDPVDEAAEEAPIDEPETAPASEQSITVE